MFDSKIYVGLSDRESHEQRHDTEYYKTVLKDVCRNRHASFSLQVIEGGYFHENGSWVDENTLLITLIDTPRRVVYEIAKEMCALFHQESVMITSNPVRRINVYDDLDKLDSGEEDRDILGPLEAAMSNGPATAPLAPLMERKQGRNVVPFKGLQAVNSTPEALQGVKIEPLEIAFSVCKVEDYSGIDIGQPFVFTGTTDQEKSLVCPTELVPANTTHRDDGWRAFRIVGELDFSLIGILAGISQILAQNKIGIFAVSTYNTDYILTKEENFDRAVALLKFIKI